MGSMAAGGQAWHDAGAVAENSRFRYTNREQGGRTDEHDGRFLES